MIKRVMTVPSKMGRGVSVRNRVIIVSGLAGSGKSTLAQDIAKKFDMKCIHASGILRELLKKDVDDITDGAGKNTGWWESAEGRKFLENRTKDGKFDRMLDKKLLEILACPKCKGDLEYRTEPDEVLICLGCKLVYEIRDDIQIMLIDEAKPLKE